MCHFRLQYLYRCGRTYAAPSIENCEFKMVCSSCENSGHLSVAVAQFTVAEEPERNLEIIDGFARDAAVGDREADLITAELSVSVLIPRIEHCRCCRIAVLRSAVV